MVNIFWVIGMLLMYVLGYCMCLKNNSEDNRENEALRKWINEHDEALRSNKGLERTQ